MSALAKFLAKFGPKEATDAMISAGRRQKSWTKDSPAVLSAPDAAVMQLLKGRGASEEQARAALIEAAQKGYITNIDDWWASLDLPKDIIPF